MSVATWASSVLCWPAVRTRNAEVEDEHDADDRAEDDVRPRARLVGARGADPPDSSRAAVLVASTELSALAMITPRAFRCAPPWRRRRRGGKRGGEGPRGTRPPARGTSSRSRAPCPGARRLPAIARSAAAWPRARSSRGPAAPAAIRRGAPSPRGGGRSRSSSPRPWRASSSCVSSVAKMVSPNEPPICRMNELSPAASASSARGMNAERRRRERDEEAREAEARDDQRRR